MVAGRHDCMPPKSTYSIKNELQPSQLNWDTQITQAIIFSTFWIYIMLEKIKKNNSTDFNVLFVLIPWKRKQAVLLYLTLFHLNVFSKCFYWHTFQKARSVSPWSNWALWALLKGTMIKSLCWLRDVNCQTSNNKHGILKCWAT